jgi:hypothetical protein
MLKTAVQNVLRAPVPKNHVSLLNYKFRHDFLKNVNSIKALTMMELLNETVAFCENDSNNNNIEHD